MTDDDLEIRHGLDAVEDYDGDGDADGILWFDPREKGPRELIGDGRRWISNHPIYVIGSVVGLILLQHFVGVSTPQLPPWTDVAVTAGGIATGIGIFVGLRVGEFFATPQHRIVSQLDAKSGDQDLLKISTERWHDLTVLDHEGEPRSRNYLKEVVINGSPAIEVDRYYPALNTAIASWQAGASNKDLRDYEHKVDIVKTKLEKEANEAIEARVNAEERAREQAMQTSNYILAVTESVLQPGEGDLSSRLEEITTREDTESHEELLGRIEEELRSDHSSNGHDQEADVDDVDQDPGRLDSVRRRAGEVRSQAGEIVIGLDPRDGGKNE